MLNSTDGNIAEARILNSFSTAKIITTFSTLRVSTKPITAKIANVLVLDSGDSGGGNDDDMSITYSFTANDLVDGKITKTHNKNKYVDVSVFDESGTEIMVGLDILNLNQVVIDLGRAIPTGVWRVLID